MKRRRPAIIEFRGVEVRRGLKPALVDFSVKIHGGESVAILGPNGSGKSTFIRTITRESYPYEGQVRLFGADKWDVFRLRSRLGIVANELQLRFHRGVTVRDVALSGYFSGVGIWPNNRVTPEMEKGARRALRFLGIDALAGRAMDEISSGEARRALIARSLVNDPEALILDEPTNSLDLSATAQFQSALRKVIRSGKTVILATHHLHDIVPEIRRVVFIKDGRVAGEGPKDLLLTSESVSRLFGRRLTVAHRRGYYHVEP